MRKKLFLLPALFLGASLTFIPACGECEDGIDCGYGYCLDGVCVCPDGYEDSSNGTCDTEWSAKFLGSYTGNDGCRGPLAKPADITRRSKSQIRISNFGDFDSYVDADITDPSGNANVFELSNYTDPAGRKFTGSGTLNGNSIKSSYTVTYADSTSETCTFNVTK